MPDTSKEYPNHIRLALDILDRFSSESYESYDANAFKCVVAADLVLEQFILNGAASGEKPQCPVTSTTS